MLNLPMDLKFDELMTKIKTEFPMQLSHLQLLGLLAALVAGFFTIAIYVLHSRKPKGQKIFNYHLIKLFLPSVWQLIFFFWLFFSGCLEPEKFKEFKLVKKTQLSHNASKFRFALPKPTSVFGLPLGQHIVCRLTISFSFYFIYLSMINIYIF